MTRFGVLERGTGRPRPNTALFALVWLSGLTVGVLAGLVIAAAVIL